ncbi:MAG TPA: outer membrane beta-barrel protein, partial [Myxococcota bacterium]|nr:outer membrane beta-barrel protein [Myxococcota bacterium]
MRSSLKRFIAVAAAFLVAPSFASADDAKSEDELQEVLSRMSELEQQLKATNDALAASNAKVEKQQETLSKLEPSNQSGAMLALSNFLTETTFAGWVSASYFYNTNNPDNGRNIGANAGTIGANPYHQNHNSFQVDQVWFSMANEATPESRAGFAIDILYGEAADQLAIGLEGNSIFDYLYNANVSYLAPFTDAGIKVTAGRFEKHIGSETAQDPYNYNITRGLLYTLQPINFTGVKASSKYDNGLRWMVGISNDSGYATLDTNPYAAFPNAQNY